MKRGLNYILININKTVNDALRVINENGLQAVVVVDNERHLKGVVSDGDIRRWVLAQRGLDTDIKEIMNPSPIYAKVDTTEYELRQLMFEHVLHMIPIIDENYKVTRIVHYTDLINDRKIDIPVVLMAGGLGTRLKGKTKNCPKPLLKVGKKPILETIIEEFRGQGFHDFYIAVNYKAEMIERYFQGGDKLGVSIQYIKEKERLGTAGALSLLPEGITYPIIVMNADILTKVSYEKIVKNHKEENATITVALREYTDEIPFGVVNMDERSKRIMDIYEKPVNRYNVSAGIYVLSKAAKDMIPTDEFLDMPQLIEKLLMHNEKVNGFVIDDYWIDIGIQEEFQRAEREYGLFF